MKWLPAIMAACFFGIMTMIYSLAHVPPAERVSIASFDGDYNPSADKAFNTMRKVYIDGAIQQDRDEIKFLRNVRKDIP